MAISSRPVYNVHHVQPIIAENSMRCMLLPCHCVPVSAVHRAGSVFARSVATRSVLACDHRSTALSASFTRQELSPSGKVRGAHADEASMSDWPCKVSALESARSFVREVASKGGKVLLAPDRDADGLCAGRPTGCMSAYLQSVAVMPDFHRPICLHQHASSRIWS